MNKLILLMILVLLMFLIDIKYVLIICFIIYILKNDNKLKSIIEKNLVSEDIRVKYNTEIEKILKKIKKHKKNNKQQYLKGIEYWRLFIKMIHKLEDNKIGNYNQYFDKAFDYLKESVNYFHSINVSISEKTLIDGIKDSDFTTALSKEISLLSKDLYKEGYLILYNLSIKLNKRWKENPNINSKPIIFDHPLSYNYIDNSFNFYI